MFSEASSPTITQLFRNQPVVVAECLEPKTPDPGKDGRESENQTIQAAKRGDPSAFNELVLAYQDSLYGWVFFLLKDHAVAEDVTQAAFITAYEKLGTFRGGSFRSWLFKIARNRSFDELRRMKRAPAVSVDAHKEEEDCDLYSILAGDEPQIEAALIQREQAETIHRLINALPAKFSQVLRLAEIDGLDYREVAELLQLPMGTVKSRLARARLLFHKSVLENRQLL